MRAPLRLLPVLALATILGCPNAGEDRLLTVGATGILKGLVVFDLNGNRSIDQGDDSLAGIRVRLVTTGARDSVAAGVSLVSGDYRMDVVPAGTYLVVVDTAPFADTVNVAKLDSSQVTILPGDSVVVNVLVSYPHVSVRAARTTVPLGRKVFVEGVGLNSPASFRDTTLHLQDTSAAIRSTRVRAVSVVPGDSLRLRGTTSQRDGQRTLDDVTPIFLVQTFVPQAAQLTSAVAASAAGGTRDAQLIQVRGATVTDSLSVPGGFRLIVSDGSGALEVLLDGTAVPNLTPGLYVPGNKFDIVGVLVPTSAPGVWRLKPRSSVDLVKQP